MLLLALLGVANAAKLWGADGHHIVAGIAQSLLIPGANTRVNTILGGATMASVASWADEVRSQRPWSAPLHFIDTPDWACTYVPTRDCVKDECVAGAITNYTARVVNETGVLQQEALKFLIHFVGDIHQPLHVGFTSDRGGNSLHGTFFSASTNLHSVWDTAIISHRISTGGFTNVDGYMNALITRIRSGNWSSLVPSWNTCQTSAPHNACANDWAKESIVDACKYSYVTADGTTRITSPFSLAAPYFDRTFPVIELQLAKAGARLAHVINSLFPKMEVMRKQAVAM